MTHSRNHSQDSATSYRSTDGSRTSYEAPSYPYEMYDSIVIPRRASHTLSNEPFQVLRRDIEQVHHHGGGHENGSGYQVFETHSLPRRTCIHHKPEEFHTHTLPRRDHHSTHHHHEIIFKDQLKMPPQEVLIPNGSGGINQPNVRSFDSNSLNRRMSSAHASQDKQNQPGRRASYAYVNPADTHSLTRRNSITHQQVQMVQPMIQAQRQQQQQLQQPAPQPVFQPLIKPQPPIFSTPSHPPPSCPITPPNIQPLDMQDDTKSSSDESCSTCESESEKEDDKHEEKEIFIDFKPRVSPIPSPSTLKKKKLQKTLSEGEILLDRSKPTKPTATAASQEHLQSPPETPQQQDSNLQFSETPIKDEGAFLGSPTSSTELRKESFRKRSVSLDEPTSTEYEEDEGQEKGLLEEMEADGKDDKMVTAPPSPSREERLSIKSHSPFHSSESLATRDNSDGIWNESQATIMTTR